MIKLNYFCFKMFLFTFIKISCCYFWNIWLFCHQHFLIFIFHWKETLAISYFHYIFPIWILHRGGICIKRDWFKLEMFLSSSFAKKKKKSRVKNIRRDNITDNASIEFISVLSGLFHVIFWAKKEPYQNYPFKIMFLIR